MQTSGRELRNESCRLCTSFEQAEGKEVIMYQSTETEQLKRPQLNGTMSEVMKSERKGEDLRLPLKRLNFDLISKLGGSISTSQQAKISKGFRTEGTLGRLWKATKKTGVQRVKLKSR